MSAVNQDDRQEGPIDEEWVAHHFDPHAPELGPELHRALGMARATCPVAHSDQHGGFWLSTRYEDVLRVAQNWETFSSELGITVPNAGIQMKILPVTVDPPLHRTFKRLINAYFTPRAVEPWEADTRAIVNRLIDGFIDKGSCDFMAEFARPFPGLAFFELALHAPSEDLEKVNDWATGASLTGRPDHRDCLMNLFGWMSKFLESRRAQPPMGDVVDAVLNAEIEGRPITDEEATGTVQLLVLGGLETTAGVLGMSMLRFCEHPEIFAQMRAHPERIPDAVEELLRLDSSFVCIARTARHDAELAGNPIREGESVLISWASANRDEGEFENPDEFDLGRTTNRHVTFGAGPHRCAGSNLARMNLRIAFEELVRRLSDIRLQEGAEIGWNSTFNRAPLSVPITFTAEEGSP